MGDGEQERLGRGERLRGGNSSIHFYQHLPEALISLFFSTAWDFCPVFFFGFVVHLSLQRKIRCNFFVYFS